MAIRISAVDIVGLWVIQEYRESRNIARRVDVGSACVDIRPSPKTDVLVLISAVLQLCLIQHQINCEHFFL